MTFHACNLDYLSCHFHSTVQCFVCTHCCSSSRRQHSSFDCELWYNLVQEEANQPKIKSSRLKVSKNVRCACLLYSATYIPCTFTLIRTIFYIFESFRFSAFSFNLPHFTLLAAKARLPFHLKFVFKGMNIFLSIPVPLFRRWFLQNNHARQSVFVQNIETMQNSIYLLDSSSLFSSLFSRFLNRIKL